MILRTQLCVSESVHVSCVFLLLLRHAFRFADYNHSGMKRTVIPNRRLVPLKPHSGCVVEARDACTIVSVRLSSWRTSYCACMVCGLVKTNRYSFHSHTSSKPNCKLNRVNRSTKWFTWNIGRSFRNVN